MKAIASLFLLALCVVAVSASSCGCLPLALTIPQALCQFRPCSSRADATSCNQYPWCIWTDTTNQDLLTQHSVDFNTKQIVQVTQPGQFPQVYSAIGFGLSNSIIIVGNNGYFVVDTSESVNASALVRASVLATLGVKPVVAIAYTHSHADHISGTDSWLAAFPPYLPAVNPPIYGHATWQTNLNLDLLITPATANRSFFHFGSFLPSGQLINDGIGPFLNYDNTKVRTYHPPTITFATSLNTQIDGYNVEFLFAPGENGDEINIYLPDVNVVVAGDNVYDAFPDVYALRGVRARPARDWWTSIDAVRDLAPSALALTHTQPIIGSQNVATALQNYRDMLQYTHDKTVAGLSIGLPATYIARNLQLPVALSAPGQFYGTLASSVLAINDYYVGYFNGQVSSLEPLDPFTQSLFLLQSFGGPEQTLILGENFMLQKNLDATRWALQLFEAILTVNIGVSKGLYTVPVNPRFIPDDDNIHQATQNAIVALNQLGVAQISGNVRNYYLSAAAQLQGAGFATSPAATAVALLENPISLLFEFLPLKFNVSALSTGLTTLQNQLPVPLQPFITPLFTEYAVQFNLADAGLWTARLRTPSDVAEIRQPSAAVGTFPLIITSASLPIKEMFVYASTNPAIISQLVSSGAIQLSTGFQQQIVQFALSQVQPAVVAAVTPQVTTVVTQQVTAAVTQQITVQVTAGVTQQITAQVTSAVTQQITSAVTAAVTQQITTQVTALVTEEITNQINATTGGTLSAEELASLVEQELALNTTQQTISQQVAQELALSSTQQLISQQVSVKLSLSSTQQLISQQVAQELALSSTQQLISQTVSQQLALSSTQQIISQQVAAILPTAIAKAVASALPGALAPVVQQIETPLLTGLLEIFLVSFS